MPFVFCLFEYGILKNNYYQYQYSALARVSLIPTSEQESA